MKKTQMLIPLLAILLFASAVTPVLAAKEKNEKIPAVKVAKKPILKIYYDLQGNIMDVDKGFYGDMSLALSGKIVGSPDYTSEYSFDQPTAYESIGSYEYDYYEDENGVSVHYMYSYYEESSFDGWESGVIQTTKWYSPLPKFNSKIEVAWFNSPTTMFKASLTLSMVEKSYWEGTAAGDYVRIVKEVIYVENDGEWIEHEVLQDINESGYSSTTYSEVQLYFAFIGKIQSKGSKTYLGTLELWDVDSTRYGQYVMGRGRFGPYDLNIYT
jgi:hypothetical protein